MSSEVTSVLREAIQRALSALWPDVAALPAVVLEVPPTPEYGDFATSIALQLAQSLKQQPADIAEKLAECLRLDVRVKEWVREVNVVSPGFVNFTLDSERLFKTLPAFQRALREVRPRKEKIVIEHTNVNPNKAMHIGHLRNSVLGDTIAKVLSRVGFEIEVQYYVDDTGVQVADTYLGMQELKVREIPGEKFDHYCWRVYADITQAYAEDPELLDKRIFILREVEKGTTTTAREVKELAARIVKDHLRTMEAFHIAYDLLVWESDVLAFGFWGKAFERLKTSEVFVKEEEGKNAGCWVIKTGDEAGHEDFSLDKVIVKSDGSVTYTGKDIAYHLWKYNLLGKDFLYSEWPAAGRGRAKLASTSTTGAPSETYGHAQYVYNVIDVRQSYPQAMVKLALEHLGFKEQAERLRHVSYGIVSLASKAARELGVDTEDGKRAYSMSGRKGIGIKVDDLLDRVEDRVSHRTYAVESDRSEASICPHDVAVGAIKYFMLRYNPQTDIVFDFDEALTLEGNTGPYIQYAHARMAGILSRSGSTVFEISECSVFTPEEERLLKKMYQWPHVVERAAHELTVNLITAYAFELANAFNSFYEAVPVLKEEGAVREQRLALVFFCKEILADVLSVLGIEAPEKM